MATQNLASHVNAHPDAHDKLYKQVALRISELIEHGTLRQPVVGSGGSGAAQTRADHRADDVIVPLPIADCGWRMADGGWRTPPRFMVREQVPKQHGAPHEPTCHW